MTATTSTVKSNWGRWGDDDERGALNLLTPEVIKAATASIKHGKVYSLGIPIQSHGVPLMDYRGTPMRLTLQDSTDDGVYAIYGCHVGTGAHERLGRIGGVPGVPGTPGAAMHEDRDRRACV